MGFYLTEPLEQFLVLPLFTSNIVPWLGTNVYLLVVSNFVVQLFLLVIITSCVCGGLRSFIPFYTSFLTVLSLYLSFVATLLTENFPRRGFHFFPYLFFLLSFLLLANLSGMIPWSFAITSHLAVTFFLSFVTFFVAVALGLQLHAFSFFGLFLPNGVPFLLTPFIVIVELISYSARLFSLAIRLFANIMSGHTLMKILAAFCWLLLSSFSLLWVLPFLIIVLVTALELVIAFLQAYVFTTLTIIYWNEAFNLH
jgi:ATP synthase subunit 6